MKRIVIIASLVMLGMSGVAYASHAPQRDPATVPAGFLVTHSSIKNIPVDAVARAAKPDGAEVFIQHIQLASRGATMWHTHPGPVFVSVVKGSLTHEDAHHSTCRQVTYAAGEGFVDEGFGHVHRAVAGAEGADFYAVYVLPAGSATHVAVAPAPEACA